MHPIQQRVLDIINQRDSKFWGEMLRQVRICRRWQWLKMGGVAPGCIQKWKEDPLDPTDLMSWAIEGNWVKCVREKARILLGELEKAGKGDSPLAQTYSFMAYSPDHNKRHKYMHLARDMSRLREAGIALNNGDEYENALLELVTNVC